MQRIATPSNNLKTLRDLRGLSQHQLALKCGLTVSHITKYERGKNRPGVDHAYVIAQALGFPVETVWFPKDAA